MAMSESITGSAKATARSSSKNSSVMVRDGSHPRGFVWGCLRDIWDDHGGTDSGGSCSLPFRTSSTLSSVSMLGTAWKQSRGQYCLARATYVLAMDVLNCSSSGLVISLQKLREQSLCS